MTPSFREEWNRKMQVEPGDGPLVREVKAIGAKAGADAPDGEQRGVHHGDAEGATSASRSHTLPAATTEPLTHIEVEQLAAYNTRVYQGIVHTEETKARMAELQHRFDTAGYTLRRRRKLRAWRPDE